MWRRYKGRCLPARNTLGGGAFEAISMVAFSNVTRCTINLLIIYVPYRTPSGRAFEAISMVAFSDPRTVTITSFIIYVPYRTPSGRGF